MKRLRYTECYITFTYEEAEALRDSIDHFQNYIRPEYIILDVDDTIDSINYDATDGLYQALQAKLEVTKIKLLKRPVKIELSASDALAAFKAIERTKYLWVPFSLVRSIACLPFLAAVKQLADHAGYMKLFV